MRQPAAVLALLAGRAETLLAGRAEPGADVLLAGRAEPGADVLFAVPETAAPEPHPAASTHPTTIAITRGILIIITTATDGVWLPNTAGPGSS